MSTLRRFPSLECAELAAPLLSSSTCKISRHLSLPSLSHRNLQGLPPLPPRRLPHGTCRASPSCYGHQHDGSHRKLFSFRSLPTWFADNEEDLCSVHASTISLSRKESFGMEDSVVYRELSESIHLQLPGRYGFMLGSSSVRDDDGRGPFEKEDKVMDLPLSDVRGQPMSLRMLKCRVPSKLQRSVPCSSSKQQVNGGACTSLADKSRFLEGFTDSLPIDINGSISSAVTSLVYMMESLQQQSLRLRRALISEADAHLQMMMELVHQEVQETFLWLFQKVFACTPKLMLLTMMVLADFTAHSMGEHVALALMPMGEPPTCAIERCTTISSLPIGLREAASDGFKSYSGDVRALNSHVMQESVQPCFCEGGAGNGVTRVVKVGGGMEGDTVWDSLVDRVTLTSRDDAFNGTILVAPVHAPALEADNYACYDRTDLNYQHELSRDPANPLLLSNYAQFLHVVRHDLSRAEELYRRAVKSDPVDGELMGKYASFLWVAKEDVEAADEVYKAALEIDPSNAYHAGSYAHFLWNSGVDQDDMSSPIIAYQEVSTS